MRHTGLVFRLHRYANNDSEPSVGAPEQGEGGGGACVVKEEGKLRLPAAPSESTGEERSVDLHDPCSQDGITEHGGFTPAKLLVPWSPQCERVASAAIP